MMLFSSLSIVIVIVIVPRRLLWWSRGIEMHILLLLIIVQWIISHYLIVVSIYAPHNGCHEGTCRCGAAAPVRRGEQRGDRWGNIDDWWLHGCLIVVEVRIIICCRTQIVTSIWTDGTMLIVSVVLCPWNKSYHRGADRLKCTVFIVEWSVCPYEFRYCWIVVTLFSIFWLFIFQSILHSSDLIKVANRIIVPSLCSWYQ